MKVISEWSKKQKLNAVMLGLFAFVVFPLFTAILLSFENPIRHSITEMTFRMGYRAPFTVWGILFIVFTVFTMIETLKESSFPKWIKIFLFVYVGVIETLLIVTGACSDNSDVVAPIVVSIHNKSAIGMFVGHIVLLGLLTIFSFFRNRIQGFIELIFFTFFGIVVIYFYVRITASDTFTLLHAATAVCEAVTFCMAVIFLYVNYIGNLLFLPAKKT